MGQRWTTNTVKKAFYKQPGPIEIMEYGGRLEILERPLDHKYRFGEVEKYRRVSGSVLGRPSHLIDFTIPGDGPKITKLN